jgi:hypothetical protein
MQGRASARIMRSWMQQPRSSVAGELRYVIDGLFAETNVDLMGIQVVDCEAFGDAVAAAERLTFDTGVFEPPRSPVRRSRTAPFSPLPLTPA